MKSQEELLKSLHLGDERAIRNIFDEFYEALCLYAATIIKNYPDAEEIVEDIFIYLWINASNLVITISLKNYLYKSVYNNCLKYLQKEKKEKRQADDLIQIKSHELFYTSAFENPESDMIIEELEKKADAIREGLPPQCKEIYTMSRVENMSYSQIAEKLKISVGTVKTQMSRAFQKFRKDFGEYLPVMALAATGTMLTL